MIFTLGTMKFARPRTPLMIAFAAGLGRSRNRPWIVRVVV